jgi:hypothetical protein
VRKPLQESIVVLGDIAGIRKKQEASWLAIESNLGTGRITFHCDSSGGDLTLFLSNQAHWTF